MLWGLSFPCSRVGRKTTLFSGSSSMRCAFSARPFFLLLARVVEAFSRLSINISVPLGLHSFSRNSVHRPGYTHHPLTISLFHSLCPRTPDLPINQSIHHLRHIQLFENQSVVEYWENFASHAFETSTQSVCSHCVLLKPSGDPVTCAFCFTIRRNMFDLPELIIGKLTDLHHITLMARH